MDLNIGKSFCDTNTRRRISCYDSFIPSSTLHHVLSPLCDRPGRHSFGRQESWTNSVMKQRHLIHRLQVGAVVRSRLLVEHSDGSYLCKRRHRVCFLVELNHTTHHFKCKSGICTNETVSFYSCHDNLGKQFKIIAFLSIRSSCVICDQWLCPFANPLAPVLQSYSWTAKYVFSQLQRVFINEK
jgi:hypothetical protein